MASARGGTRSKVPLGARKEGVLTGLYSPWRYGLEARSRSRVDAGPWPGRTVVAPGRPSSDAEPGEGRAHLRAVAAGQVGAAHGAREQHSRR